MTLDFLDVASFIQNEIKRNVTLINSIDGDSTKKNMALQTVITQVELVSLRDYVYERDNNAFIFATMTTSVIGNGFDLE